MFLNWRKLFALRWGGWAQGRDWFGNNVCHGQTHTHTGNLHQSGWSENGAKNLIILTRVAEIAGNPNCQETNSGETLFRVFRKKKRKLETRKS